MNLTSSKCTCFPALRIAIFSITVLKDDRIVVVAEQRPQCTEEEVRERCFFIEEIPNYQSFIYVKHENIRQCLHFT